ncbi:MAG: hypothetical protein HY766_14030, partial [candidate division NC10 bacterium]|nr:hypothetical protein [candidate division NC10 bacterium]
ASVGVLILAGVTYRIVRRRRVVLRAPSHAPATPPSVGAVATRPAVPPGPTELALRKVELVAALAELEAGHEPGRVPEKEYRRLRQEKRKALRDVLAQLDEGRATAATTSRA